MDRRKRQGGISLVEVMVGMVILGVVSSQALGMLQSQLHTYHSQSRVLDIQEDSRTVADMILADVRMSGFMIPNIAGIASVDGGVNAPDSLCVSEWSLMDDAKLSDASSRFDRASLTGDPGGGANTVDLTAADMDIDGDGDNDFLVNSGIIISSGTESHCARIQAIAGNQVTFLPTTPAGFTAPIPGSRAVPAIVYELTGGTLTRNNLLLSTQVEDLQVRYDVDVDGDGAIDFGVDANPGPEDRFDSLDTLDHTLIRQIRLFVLTRTSSEDLKLTGIGRQGVANRNAAAAPDDFRRRLVSVTAAPRNLL